MPNHETEWSLQKRLTRSWLEHEPVVLDGVQLFLAAWEVMTDFRINDPRRHWSSPSIDFVFLDSAGCMVLAELKNEIRTPRESWSVVCQVTHRAHELAAGYSRARLESAYVDCHSGVDGRVPDSSVPTDLLRAHAATFNRPALSQLPGYPARRVIMAKDFGPAFASVLSAANSQSRDQLVAALGRYKPRGEIKRYLDLRFDESLVAAEPIRAVTVDGLPWTSAADET